MPIGRLGAAGSRFAQLVLAHSGASAGSLWTEAYRAKTWTEATRMPTWTETSRTTLWSAPTMTALVKRAGETRLYTMDLSLLPEIAGTDTVASVTSILCTSVVQGPGAVADLTLSSKAVASGNKGAQCKIAGGTDGTTYLITFTVLTTAGYTLVGIGYLYVDDR